MLILWYLICDLLISMCAFSVVIWIILSCILTLSLTLVHVTIFNSHVNIYKTHVNVVLQNKKKVLQSHARKCVIRAQFDWNVGIYRFCVLIFEKFLSTNKK